MNEQWRNFIHIIIFILENEWNSGNMLHNTDEVWKHMLGQISRQKNRQQFLIPPFKSVMPSKHLILCSPLLTPSIFPSIRVFPVSQFFTKYWSFSFSISSSNEYSALNSFRIDQLDLLTVQGTLKSLLQHHSSKASILRHSAFFIIQLLGRNIAVTRWNLLAR